MQFKVGETIGLTAAFALPDGSKFELVDGVSLRILEIPEEDDHVENMAKDLWSVRNEISLDHFGFEDEWDRAGEGSFSQSLFRGLAQYVIDRFGLGEAKALTGPSVVIDRDGDRWERQEDGTYSMRSRVLGTLYTDEELSGHSLDHVRCEFGIREEIA